MLMLRGERASADGDFAIAATHFERAAVGYETLGEPLPAAEAALELGRCLLYLERGELLPALAARIENLVREEAASLPAGGLISLHVWSQVLRWGASEPGPLLQLIRIRRRVTPRYLSSSFHFLGAEGGDPVVSGASPIKKKIEKQLEKMAKAKKRLGLLRETALLTFGWVPNIRKTLEYVAEGLYKAAGALPLDASLLGESVTRAKLRAMGRELRHLQDFAGEVTAELRQADSVEGATLDPADRRLCEWAEEQRREIMRLAVRFERRVGPAPKVQGKGSED
jgi:hypothetical protein